MRHGAWAPQPIPPGRTRTRRPVSRWIGCGMRNIAHESLSITTVVEHWLHRRPRDEAATWSLDRDRILGASQRSPVQLEAQRQVASPPDVVHEPLQLQ